MLPELDEEIIKGAFHQTEEPFSAFSTIIRDVVDKNAPLNQKGICGNNAPFMNSQLSKNIIDLE